MLALALPASASTVGITEISGNYDRSKDRENPAKIVIYLNKTRLNVTKEFYGSHIDSYSQMPKKELVDELQLGKIRVGGNEFDVFNWKINKAVTASGEIINVTSFEELSKELKSFNVNGIFQINLSGYQPVLIDDKYVITRSFTSESAYDLVKHLNGILKLKIIDFSLGNEFSIWHEAHRNFWHQKDGIKADEYINRYIEFAIAIRKAQDEINGKPNSIKIWGPEISTSWNDWNTGNFSNDCKWTDIKGRVTCTYGNGRFKNFLPYFFYRLKLAERNSTLNPKHYKLLDYVAFHYYPNYRSNINDPNAVFMDSNGTQPIAEILESTRVFNDPAYINKLDISSYRNFSPNILTRMKEWMAKYYPNAKLAVNEFAVDSDYRSNNYHPIIRPLYLADLIGILTTEGVSFLNFFLLSSKQGSNLPWSLIKGGVRENLFYMYKLFSNHYKGNVVPVEDNLGNVVNAYAVVENNLINLAVINKDPLEKKIQIYVNNGIARKVTTYLVPGWSASILKIPKDFEIPSKQKIKIYQYGASEMNIALNAALAKKNNYEKN